MQIEPVAAALISATASVVVALVNKQRPRVEAPGAGHLDRGAPTASTRHWLIAITLLSAWLVIAPNVRWANYQSAVAVNFAVVVPVLAVAAAYFFAPTPLLAASGVFALHAVNAAAMAVVQRHGFMIASSSDVALLLGLFTANALIAGLATQWRAARVAGAMVKGINPAVPAVGEAAAPDLVRQLAELAELRGAGHLTDDEYAAAKKRLLQ